MLYGNESISQYSRSNVAIWMLMAFQAGALNMGGFMACHRFVSHVTGFATFFGYEASQLNYGRAVGILAVPVFFLIGAMISAQLVDIRIKRKERPRYYKAFGIIFSLILIVLAGGICGQFGAFGEPLEITRDYILLGLLCLSCGIQNGTITSVSRSVVRTTHLTGITTDLGIGIMRLINKNKIQENLSDERKANFMRVGLIASFVFGSLLAGFVFRHLEYYGFVLPALTSGFLFLAMLIFRKKTSRA